MSSKTADTGDKKINESTAKEFSSMSSGVVLKNIIKRFPTREGTGEFTAVDNVSLEVHTGELVTLLGPSGCGKTTTLRMVSGFEFPTSGEVLIGGKNVENVPPNKRNISMVFQNYALFPHMNIYDNIVYGLKLKRMKKEELKDKANKIIDLMQLRGMEERFPSEVSGGQQQRVALARAVVIEPKVLLFDEPLSNLDAKLREHMRDELRNIQKTLGITSLYVTHDQSEAMAISDRVAIMKDGKLMQIGTPKEIYDQPGSRFIANFMGKANFIEGKIEGTDGGCTVIKVQDSPLKIPNPGKVQLSSGDTAYMSIRPESIKLSKEGGVLKGIVKRATYYGSKIEYCIEIGKDSLIVEIPNPQLSVIFGEGDGVFVDFDMECIRLLKD